MNEDVLNALEAAADEPELSRSSFWESELECFSFTAEGKMNGLICIGSVSKKIARQYKALNWLLQLPYRFIVRNSLNFASCNRLARLVAERQGRLFTSDMLRQALALTVILDNLELTNSDQANLVIGDGYGVMTSLLKLFYPKRTLITVNLTTPLLVDLVYAQWAVPGLRIALPTNEAEMKEALSKNDIDVIAIRADMAKLIAEASVGLAVNIYSMQEMTGKVIQSYFDILRGNKSNSTAFYCCNRVSKKLYDGEESRFAEYPWQEDDKIIFDEDCRWESFEYQSRPPFWLRNLEPKKHRLTILGSAQQIPTPIS
jgi:hypothetical protein